MPGKANNLSLKLSVPFEPVKEAGDKKMVITSHSVEKNISSNVNNPWKLKVSQRALGIVNPIRQVIEQMGAPRSDKKMIPLSQGDPTLFGNLRTCNSVLQAVVETTTSGRGDGYSHSCGEETSRQVVADSHSPPGFPVPFHHVFLTAGCSQSLEKSIAVLAQDGCNMLLPMPAFPLYETICSYYGVEPRFYRLLAHSSWEADLNHLQSLVDKNTSALLICNPGNPSGHNYSRHHLSVMVNLAERNRLPIISDEVYEGMVFKGEEFVSVAEVSKNVPVLTVGSISKRCLVPGWRCGWIVAHDRQGILSESGALEALGRLQTITLGPCGIIQAALPIILDTSSEWMIGIMRLLETNADVCVRRLQDIPGLKLASRSQGAMYLMVEIEAQPRFSELHPESVSDDMSFCRLLLEQEALSVLPGCCFRAPGLFRLCFAAPPEVLEEAFDRLQAFCLGYFQEVPLAMGDVEEGSFAPCTPVLG
mmetsp:Transcript_27846/g.38495  ORF Transcript_27846/g.38495 Transcript_27846/m.38495 type:complete len:477 (-) Transcript_27846:183-1613(-)